MQRRQSPLVPPLPREETRFPCPSGVSRRRKDPLKVNPQFLYLATRVVRRDRTGIPVRHILSLPRYVSGRPSLLKDVNMAILVSAGERLVTEGGSGTI